MRTTGAIISQVASHRGSLARMEIAAIDQELRKAREAKNQLGKEVDEAWTALAAALVPSLALDVLDGRARQLGLPAIASGTVTAQHAAYVEKQRRAIAAQDADPAWQKRDEIENVSQIKLAELTDAIAPLAESVQTLEYEPYFAELVRAGYDTDAYQGRFWQLSYYRHWKNADLVVAAHGARLKCARFGELRAKYLGEREALTSLLEDKRREERVLQESTARRTERTRLDNNLADAPARVLAAVRGAVQAHLRPVDRAALTGLVAGDRTAEIALMRIAGVEKKGEYLDAMKASWLQKPRDDLLRFVDKAGRAESKYARPKNWSRAFDIDVDRMFPDKSQSWLKRRQRYAMGSSQMLAYNDWNRVRFGDVLWWDLFMGDRYDGSFIPEVDTWHRSRGFFESNRDLDRDLDRESAAAAVADAQLRDDDTSLGRDVS